MPRATAEAHAEAVNRYLFPQLATKADLDGAIGSLKVWLVTVLLGVAGVSIAIAKLI